MNINFFNNSQTFRIWILPLLCCLLPLTVNAFELKKFMMGKNIYTRTNYKYLNEGKVIMDSNVKTVEDESSGKQQKLALYLAGMHSQKCEASIEKLKNYEQYSEYISFIKKSHYDDEQKDFKLDLNGSPFVPIDFILEVNIERLSTPKTYPYVMGAGLFKGLKGDLNIIETPDDRCLYYVTGDYLGASTNMPDTMVEILANGIGKKGLEGLFKISGHREK